MLMLRTNSLEGESFFLFGADGGAPAPQRRPQILIADPGDLTFDCRCLASTQRAQCRWQRLPRRPGLPECQPRHRAIAEKAVDAFENSGLAVLNFQGQFRRDSQS